MQKAFAVYFLANIPLLLHRDYHIEIFTLPERAECDEDDIIDAAVRDSDGNVLNLKDIYQGKLIVKNGMFMSVVNKSRIDGSFKYQLQLEPTGIEVPKDNKPLCIPEDEIDLPPGILSNYSGDHPLPTSIGRIVVNYILLCQAFGDIIPYINKTTTGGKIGDIARRELLADKVTTDQYRIFATNEYWIGHSPELFSPNITARALTTSPELHKIRDADLALYKDAIKAGDTVTMSKLEQKWIGIDKAALKGDPSLRYLLSGKAFNIVRKKLYVTYGMVENMGDKGKYSFIPQSLEEGWTQDALPTIASETRFGSYSRGIETADGGTVSNDILQVFQNTRVTQQDCGSKRTFDVAIHAGNAAGFIYRNFITDAGVIETVQPEGYESNIGKTVRFRSPMYCSAKNEGYCFICMGKLFERLDQKVMAATVLTIGSQIATMALKRMHGSSIKTVNITSFNKFVI